MGVLTKFDTQEVMTILKEIGSRDMDSLQLQKMRLLSLCEFPNTFGVFIMILGGTLSLTILLAPIGIPVMIFGWWIRRRAINSITAIECAFVEYTAPLPVKADAQRTAD